MRVRSFVAGVFAVGLLSASASADLLPTLVAVPDHTDWCVTSQPVDLQPDGQVPFGDLVFQALYLRLENSALSSHLPSIGIPFLESSVSQMVSSDAAVVVAPPPAVSGSLVTANAAPPLKFTLRVCSVVPTDAPAPPQGVLALTVPKANDYALLCEVARESACKTSIESVLRSANHATDEYIAAITWRTSQPLTNDPGAANLISSLTDHTLRPLTPGMAPPSTPKLLIVISAPTP
jgi:hypothetical protein